MYSKQLKLMCGQNSKVMMLILSAKEKAQTLFLWTDVQLNDIGCAHQALHANLADLQFLETADPECAIKNGGVQTVE